MKQKTVRLLAGITIGGLGVLVLVIALRSATVSVSASEGATEPTAPLALDAPSGVSASSFSEWTPIITDSYDGLYTTIYDIPRVVGATGAPFQWGRVTREGSPFADTLWCVQGWSGSSLVAGTDVYTDNVDTTITYGPLDMRDVVTAALSFQHWISVADGDGLEWGVSTSGTPDHYEPIVPTVEGVWETTTRNSEFSPILSMLPGQEAAYISFRFHSNGDGQVGPGVFLNDFKLWGRTYTRLHLPLIIQPVIVQGYEEDFSDVTSGWPREWERKTSNENIRGGYLLDRTRAQVWDELMASREADGDVAPLDLAASEARFLAEKDEVYYAVMHDAWDLAFVSGPFQAEGDFDLEVRARYNYVQKWYRGNRYGVLLSKEKINPENPHSVHGYSFEVEILPKDNGQTFDTPWWRFKEWYRTNWKGDDAGDEDRTVGDDPSSAIRSGLGKWNTLRIERRGTSFNLYINGTFVRTVSDNSNTGPLYVGLIGRHTGSGTTELSYDVLYEWDDITVTPR